MNRHFLRLSALAVLCAALLGPSFVIPVLGSPSTSPPAIAPGAGGVQIINADGYTAYQGSSINFPTFACASMPCTKDLQAKLDIPSATFPASVQIYYVDVGKGWQNQVFSVDASRSIMNSPHNLDLGVVTFSQYGMYVLTFVNANTQSTSWQYFHVQKVLPESQITNTLTITGTYKVVSSAILATNTTKDGMKTTVSTATVARNDSTSPGLITSMITIETVSRVDTHSGNGSSITVGTLKGTIAGVGPGECTYRGASALTKQGTPQASSNPKHWISDCTGPLQGITEITTVIRNGTFTAIVYGLPPPGPSANPYSAVVVAAATPLILVGAVLLTRKRES